MRASRAELAELADILVGPGTPLRLRLADNSRTARTPSGSRDPPPCAAGPGRGEALHGQGMARYPVRRCAARIEPALTTVRRLRHGSGGCYGQSSPHARWPAGRRGADPLCRASACDLHMMALISCRLSTEPMTLHKTKPRSPLSVPGFLTPPIGGRHWL